MRTIETGWQDFMSVMNDALENANTNADVYARQIRLCKIAFDAGYTKALVNIAENLKDELFATESYGTGKVHERL